MTATAVVVNDGMLMSVELPVGWDVEIDTENDSLVAVGHGEYEVAGLAPSITIARQDSTGDWDTLRELAAASLREMQSSYPRFRLVSSTEDADASRVLRAYDFHLDELELDVRQVQGLIDDGSLYVVNCTAPLQWADDLQPLFEHVVRSLTPE